MRTTKRPPAAAVEPPGPEESAARAVAMDCCRAALWHWLACRERNERVFNEAQERGDPPTRGEVEELDHWFDFLGSQEYEAMRRLAASVLLAFRVIKDDREMRDMPAGWKPVALDLGDESTFKAMGTVVARPEDPLSNMWNPEITYVEPDRFSSSQFGL